MLPTASGIERAMNCPGSSTLPRIEREGEWANRGTIVHAFLADLNSIGREAALAKVPADVRPFCEAFDVDAWPTDLAPEVAFAWNWRTGAARELGRNTGRAYPGLPDEYYGTADLVGLDDDSVIVIDAKSGWKPVPPAERNWQLKALALFACRAYGKNSARVAIAYVRDEAPAWDHASFHAFDLDEVEAELVALVQRIEAQAAKPVPDVKVGDWCRYCSSRAHCPAFGNLLKIIGRDASAVKKEAESDRAAAFKLWKMTETLAGDLEELVKAEASLEPIDLGDGRTYGMKPKVSHLLRPEVVRQVVEEIGGPDAVANAFETKVSKASIGRALGPRAVDALEEIFARGGIIISRSMVLREGE